MRAGSTGRGLRFATVELHREIDMRYSMQLAEVTAPVPAGPLDAAAIEATAAAFEQRYAALYGKDAGFREAGIQAITFRVRGIGVLPFSPELPVRARRPTRRTRRPRRPAPGRCASTRGAASSTPPIYDYGALRAGHVLTGPAIVEVPTTTVVVPAGTTGTVDHLGNLVPTTGGAP